MDFTLIALIGIAIAAISAAVGWVLARNAAKDAVTRSATQVEEALTRVARLEASLAIERQAYDQLRHAKKPLEPATQKRSSKVAAEGHRIRERRGRGS